MSKRHISEIVLKWIVIGVYWFVMYALVARPVLLKIRENRWGELLDLSLLKSGGAWAFLLGLLSVGLVLFSWGNKKYPRLWEAVILITLGGGVLYGCSPSLLRPLPVYREAQ